MKNIWIMLVFIGLAACQTKPEFAKAVDSEERFSAKSSKWLSDPFAECASEEQILSYLYGEWGFDRLAIATDKARYYDRIHTDDDLFPPRQLTSAELETLQTIGPKVVDELIALSLENKGNYPIIECYSENYREGSAGNIIFLVTFGDMQLPETTKRVYDLYKYYLIAENEIMIDMRMDIISGIVVPGIYVIYRRLSL